MYRGRHGMRGDPADHPEDGPTVFVTHSTHKLLAALSQTSFIHVRDGGGAIDHGRFNEVYCSQASTLPPYALIASNDVAAAMMDGPAGPALTQEVIDEAVACRLAVARAPEELAARGEWFFSPWNAEEITDPSSGKRTPFHKAPAELLATDPSCWVLHPGETWHGFDGIPDGWCMLDPIKVRDRVPRHGVQRRAGAEGHNRRPGHRLPGAARDRALADHDHMFLFLFSMGITKGKWGTLLNTLLDFKVDYDRNGPLGGRGAGRGGGGAGTLRRHGLRDLGDEIWAHMRESRQGHWQAQAYATLPRPEMTPRRAFQRLMSGEVEKVPLTASGARDEGPSKPFRPGRYRRVP